MFYLKILAWGGKYDLVGLDESALGCECDVQEGVGGEQSREPGDQVPGVIWPLHLHPESLWWDTARKFKDFNERRVMPQLATESQDDVTMAVYG